MEKREKGNGNRFEECALRFLEIKAAKSNSNYLKIEKTRYP